MNQQKGQLRLLIIAIVILVILIITPLLFYLFNFRKSGLSSDPQAWGVLGDYIGGILNPVISFGSLCVLGYLTYLVARETSEDSKRLFILERRMKAYDEMAQFVKPINSFTGKMNSAMSMLPIYSRLPNDQALNHILKIIDELRGINSFYPEFYATLQSFNVRYGHLFKYDFNSQEYKDLITETLRVSNMMSGIAADYKNLKNLPDEQRDLKKLRDLLFPVVVAIRREVETNWSSSLDSHLHR